jgi:hypothetical protein
MRVSPPGFDQGFERDAWMSQGSGFISPIGSPSKKMARNQRLPAMYT